MSWLRREGGYRCPACNGLISGKARWGGLVRTFPHQCPHCDRRLGYDLAGGIYVLREPN